MENCFRSQLGSQNVPEAENLRDKCMFETAPLTMASAPEIEVDGAKIQKRTFWQNSQNVE